MAGCLGGEPASECLTRIIRVVAVSSLFKKQGKQCRLFFGQTNDVSLMSQQRPVLRAAERRVWS